MHVYGWNLIEIGWKTLQFMRRLTKGCLTILSLAFRKPVSPLSYHSVASQCSSTVTISSSNITLTTFGHAHGSSKVFPQIRCDCLEPCDSEDKPSRLMTPRRRSAWHAKLPPYAMIAWRNVWVWPPLIRFGSAWMEVGSECCLHLRCVLLEFHLSFMRPATVLSLKLLMQDLCASSAPVLKNSLESQLANFFWQTHFVRLPEHAATQTCKCPWVRPNGIWVHCCSCRNDILLQRTVYCKRLSVSVGRWSGCGPSFDTHQHLETHQKLLQQFLVHGHRTHLISGGRLISHPHEILYFRHFRLHETQLFDSGSRAQGVGWDEIIFVGLETWNHVWYYDTLCTHARC